MTDGIAGIKLATDVDPKRLRPGVRARTE